MTINRKERFEKINERCKILESLGFEICHQDSRVRILEREFKVIDKNLVIDFSAINDKFFVKHAIKEAYRIGKLHGRNEVRSEIKNVLELEDDNILDYL